MNTYHISDSRQHTTARSMGIHEMSPTIIPLPADNFLMMAQPAGLQEEPQLFN